MEITTDRSTFHKLAKKNEIKDGFLMSLIDINTDKSIGYHYIKDHSLIDFGFILKGKLIKKITNKNGLKEEVVNSPGWGGIMFAPGSKGIVNIPGNQRLQILHLHISPRLLNSMLMENADYTPYKFRNILEGNSSDFSSRGKMDAQVKLCANQIINCNETGLPIKIYQEAKALELISLQLKWLYLNEKKFKRITFTEKERKKIHEARDIIEKNKENNLTVPEISALVGLGINKLNYGFKEVFGLTVAGFIKELKMQNAIILLETGEMSVSEVAWDIGYTNVSHFSSAFKKRFDVLPGSYLMVKKNKL